MDGFEIKQIVVRDVNTDAKVEPGIPPINDLVISELHKVGVFGITN